MSLTKAKYSMISGSPINVLDYGAVGDGITDNTSAISTAILDVPTNGTLYFPSGVYVGYILLRRSDITIMGDGSSSTTLKLPNSCSSITVSAEGGGTLTGLPNVIEIGECALGNSANTYERVNVIGLTIDGNYSNNTAPTNDVFGHGIIITKTSYCSMYDIVAKNCFATGIDNVINSNYNKIEANVLDCGNALILGGYYPNFDVNSSKFSSFNIISENGKYGVRLLDNCWGNIVKATVYNAGINGLVCNNQSVNESYANIIDAVIVDGCASGQGASIGPNFNNSQINLSIRNVSSIGLFVNGTSSSDAPTGNTIKVNTYNSGSSGVKLGQYCKYNKFNINSKQDGRSGASGTYFAVDVDGADNNQMVVSIQEGSTSQVRGLSFSSGANNNHVIDLLFDENLVQAINDLGEGNFIQFPSGSPASATASANIIDIPFAGSLFEISGNTGIVGANTSSAYKGRIITLLFQSNPIITHKTGGAGENLILSGSVDFNATAGDTLTLITDGTDWIEVSRTVI